MLRQRGLWGCGGGGGESCWLCQQARHSHRCTQANDRQNAGIERCYRLVTKCSPHPSASAANRLLPPPLRGHGATHKTDTWNIDLLTRCLCVNACMIAQVCVIIWMRELLIRCPINVHYYCVHISVAFSVMELSALHTWIQTVYWFFFFLETQHLLTHQVRPTCLRNMTDRCDKGFNKDSQGLWYTLSMAISHYGREGTRTINEPGVKMFVHG